MTEPKHTSSPVEPAIVRFGLIQRIEHGVFLLSFSLLGFTGLIQKYYTSAFSQTALKALGGVEQTRLIHHSAAIAMMVVTIYHVLELTYNLIVLRTPLSMLPVIGDFVHLYHDVMYYLGLRRHKAYYGRYNYAEKVEYLAVVWGTIIMGITGFMMWNPITTTKIFPGEAIPAAKAAHGAEAVLAVAAIVIWHFYHVHLRHFNKSMFTGKLSEKEMEHEHPAELAQIRAGTAPTPPESAELRRRRKIFYPVAAVLTILMVGSVAVFLGIETTAYATLPPLAPVTVFDPVTPTPQPTPEALPSPTPEPAAPAEADTLKSWESYFTALFKNRCSTCHATTRVSGLSLATYADALAGGESGAGIVPGDPDASWIVKVQSAGKHPGQLTDEELQYVIEWIQSGAAEK